MSQRTKTIAPATEYHRVLAGEKRRIGRGILAIVLHAMYNTLSLVFDAALRTDLANVSMDRSAGVETIGVLVPSSVIVVTAVVVWILTRRSGPARTPSPSAP